MLWLALAVITVVAGCGQDSAAPRAVSSTRLSTAPAAGSAYAATSAASSSPPCAPPTIALDPGHNPVRIDSFDPVTGAAQIDYPNGAEDHDVFAVAQQVRNTLVGNGYRVVLLKQSVDQSVTYRERVGRAERAGAVLALSIHTSPGVNAVFPQRVGLYREGVGPNGTVTRITFTTESTARASERASQRVAVARTAAEGHPVAVTDNDFGGRAPLWSGNIPIISLISTRVPWVYNEYSAQGRGGSLALTPADISAYAAGLADGVRSAVPLNAGCPAG